MSQQSEYERRRALWSELERHDMTALEPRVLRDLRVYGGAQGIWVDKTTTGDLTEDGHGVAVSILHTGRHYPDDLTDDGVIYHYPDTNRPPNRDTAEVEATKNAGKLELPVFVVLPGERQASRRLVRLGWVEDWDDHEKHFLILFGTAKPDYEPPPKPSVPFSLVEDKKALNKKSKNRRGQKQRYRIQVLSQ